MAVAQGICKNCGSLIVYNTADEQCDCIFCNAVFPKDEVISMDAELKDIVFPNEKFEKSEGGRNYYPVMPDQVKVNVEREARSQTLNPEEKEKITYEIQAKDVKAPKKTVIILSAITLAFLIAVAAIWWPLYNSRTKLLKNMQSNMGAVVSDIIEVDTAIDAEGISNGYFIAGNKCQLVKIVTNDDVDETMAKQLYINYCEQRKNVSNIKSNSDVEMTIYAKQGIYNVTNGGQVEFITDSKPLDSEK